MADKDMTDKDMGDNMVMDTSMDTGSRDCIFRSVEGSTCFS